SPSLRQVQRQKGVRATDLSRDLVAAAMELVRANWEETAPLRMLTVTAAGLTDRRESEQMSLFEEEGDDYERQSRIATAMDGIRDRFGWNPSARRRSCTTTGRKNDKIVTCYFGGMPVE
ncbi:MAG: hypothetical protein J6R77_04405, partial [Clostridia bacterium]|nr:hypothetical protein [Clostridia bacterium]